MNELESKLSDQYLDGIIFLFLFFFFLNLSALGLGCGMQGLVP